MYTEARSVQAGVVAVGIVRHRGEGAERGREHARLAPTADKVHGVALGTAAVDTAAGCVAVRCAAGGGCGRTAAVGTVETRKRRRQENILSHDQTRR